MHVGQVFQGQHHLLLRYQQALQHAISLIESEYAPPYDDKIGSDSRPNSSPIGVFVPGMFIV